MNDDQTETLGELASKLRKSTRRHVGTAFAVCAAVTIWLQTTDRPGAIAFAMIAAGSLLPFYCWSRQQYPGLPLGSLMGFQTLLFYGLPVVVSNPDVFQFPIDDVNLAAFEVGLFGASIALGWSLMAPRSALRRRSTYWQFTMLRHTGSHRAAQLGPLLLGIGVAFHLTSILGFLSVLPAGIFPILRTLADAASTGGGVLGGYFTGRGLMKGSSAVAFWILLVAHCFFTAANYTLFPSVALLVSLFVGIFVGGGRLPLVTTALIAVVFGYFNLSKFEMRNRYWEPGSAYAYQELNQLPSRYQEWFELSYDMLTSREDSTAFGHRPRVEQKLSNRVNNLINLLIAQDGVLYQGIEPLHGETYAIIPVLFIPRLFWPEKPRTHEGMVLLNVHFGRQTRAESLVTYISWGLLPEAYGNFGMFFGSILCGLVIGLATGWLEGWARGYPLTSLESLVFFLLVVQFGTSFEQVASVWLSSIFQMLVAIVGGNYFFIQRVSLRPTEP